ncbi:MAG: family 20 glycosylhydrolase [Bacteroidales bacterium]|nr:family 20 glycosylhydrolase [Candidatus Cacconaster equi]
MAGIEIQTGMDRRHFLETAAAGATALALGSVDSFGKETGKERKIRIKPLTQTVQVPFGDVKALYIMIGHNMWCQWPTEAMGSDPESAIKHLPESIQPDLKLVCKNEYWKEVTDYASERGINMLVCDLGEGLFYPSHPELAIPGTWSVEKMQQEIRRLNSMGMEVIPKLNFSTNHNGWMKDYQHMVSSKPYYQMCRDVLSDVYEIFGHPRYIHLGFDEEDNYDLQKGYTYMMMRCGENWWTDFLYITGIVESFGARAMVWSDYGWDHPDFYTRCPKSVIQCPWYYDDSLQGYDPDKMNGRVRNKVLCYYELGKNGFDVLGCGSNWVSAYKRRKGVNSDEVMGEIIKLTRRAVPEDHLMGFLSAPWANCGYQSHVKRLKEGIDLLIEGCR